MGNPQLNNSKVAQPIAPLLPSPAEQRAQRLATGRVIIVCGGRDYEDWERVFHALDTLHAREPITLVVHGACRRKGEREMCGADRWAHEWALARGVKPEPHPAEWDMWGEKAAGPMRNKQMAELGAHGCVAFPGGRGTRNMIRHAERHGIRVWRPYG